MKNTPKITVTSVTVAPGEIKVQNKHNLIQQAAQVKMQR